MLLALVSFATAAELAWLEGTWRGGSDGTVYEETWQPAVGGAMLGTFRLAKGDTVVFYELMTLTTDELRIRHFGGDLAAWEPKKRPLRFTVAEADATHAVFAATTEATRLVYTRDGDQLEVRLEKGDESHSFRFERAAPAGG